MAVSPSAPLGTSKTTRGSATFASVRCRCRRVSLPKRFCPRRPLTLTTVFFALGLMLLIPGARAAETDSASQPSTLLHWSIFDVTVANLALIAVMVVIFGAALLLPFPRGHREEPAGATDGDANGHPAAALEPGRRRRTGTGSPVRPAAGCA